MKCVAPTTCLLIVVALFGGGCLKQVIINSAADALSTRSGGGAFARDDDPELIADALPFVLKTMESLLDETPDHRGLLVGLAAGYTQYAQGFVYPPAEEAPFREAERIRRRTKKLHLRAQRYGLRALEVDHPGFKKDLARDPVAAVKKLSFADIDAMYWTGAPLLAAISLSADDMSVVAELPRAEALVNRALALDPDWNDGALHELFISYEGRSELMGGSPERAQQHFARAVELTRGLKASPYVALAEAVAIKQQDREMFDRLVERALAIDVDAAPQYRLVNTISQRRARWLHDHAEDLIL